MNPTRTTTLLLSSRLRAHDTDTPTNFTCRLDSVLDMSNVKRIVVKSAHILNMFHNVPDFANKLYMVSAVGYVVATVEPGTYDADQFVLALKDAITATGALTCLDCSYNPITFQVTITCDVLFSVMSIKDVLGDYGVRTSLNYTIGAPHAYRRLPALIETQPGVINLTSPHVHVESRALASSHSTDATGHMRNVLCIVPMTSQYGYMTEWSPGSHMLSFIDYASDRSITTIDISLCDHLGNVLTLPTNADVTIELMIIYNQF